jgi:hypothetical protein
MVIATSIVREKKDFIPFSAITSFFSVSKGTIQAHWKRSKTVLLPDGRRSVRSGKILAQMFHYISVEFGEGRPGCYDMVLNWLHTERHLSVLPDTLRQVNQRPGAFKTVLAISIDSVRCQVIVEAIQEHFQQLSAEIENAPHLFLIQTNQGLKDL